MPTDIATREASSHLLPPPAQAVPPARRRWGWVLLVAIVVLAGATYWLYPKFKASADAATTKPTDAAAARGVPVVTAVSKKSDMGIYLTGLGTVTALNTVTIHTRVDGQLDKVHFTEGQLVKEGDLLVEIDPRPFQVQLTQAEGQLAKDTASLNNAKLDFQRYDSAKEAVSQQQLDTAKVAVAQFEGSAKTDQGQVDSAQLQLSYCRITAPISGRIGLRLVDAGNIVHASDTAGLAVITEVQPIAVIFSLPQDNIPQIQAKMKNGQPLVVEAYDRSLQNKLATGKLLAMDGQIDSTTGTVRLKAIFQNEDGSLYPNQFVNARLLLDTVKDATRVPAAAIQHSPDSTFVYVVEDDKVKMRTVTLGATEGDSVAITNGLKPGETLVTDGVDKLQDGSKVTTRQHATASKGATTRDSMKDSSKESQKESPSESTNEPTKDSTK